MRLDRRDVRDELLVDRGLLHRAATVRACGGQGSLQDLVHLLRARALPPLAVLPAALPARPLRIRLRLALGEGRRLALLCALCQLELLPNVGELGLCGGELPLQLLRAESLLLGAPPLVAQEPLRRADLGIELPLCPHGLGQLASVPSPKTYQRPVAGDIRPGSTWSLAGGG